VELPLGYDGVSKRAVQGRVEETSRRDAEAEGESFELSGGAKVKSGRRGDGVARRWVFSS